MAIRVTIDIEVTNPEEVIKAHRGQIIGILSDVVLGKASKQKKVNLAVASEFINVLKDELPRELAKEMVNAKIKYSIQENISMYDEEE
ncbi:hypothetical protein [Parvicella tangerina]|uniref:Uncharacterized protein n=1 Tax=Parvicella tangerina TaxID=2829795 RepID=A0A916JQR1_9FLAO|nr:hypothetical protein [Parvicella tangerina]CAG5085097.1 hypothetical protein CRYO30217_02649 [Parvicella tangerina]